jgi:hypothetical protein
MLTHKTNFIKTRERLVRSRFMKRNYFNRFIFIVEVYLPAVIL